MPSSHLKHQVREWGGVQNGQNLIMLYQENILWTMTSNSSTKNEEHDILSNISKTIVWLHAPIIF